MSELRKDPLTNRWVIIAADRALRPGRFKLSVDNELTGPNNPFAPGNESMTPPEITRVVHRDNPNEWCVRVIPNKFPALKIEGDETVHKDGLYESMEGVGAHEVIIEAPGPEFKLHDLSPEHLLAVLQTYRDRMADLAKDPRFVSTILFRNSGAHAGATVAHGHAQLIALPMVPNEIQNRLDASRTHFESTQSSLFEAIIEREESDSRRLICANDAFICVAPYASRSPFELLIIPREQGARFENSNDEELTALVPILSESLGRLEGYLGDFAYNLIIQSAPRTASDVPWYRWHIQILPRLTQVAGFEWATQFFINPTPPEAAAEALRRIK